jgi:hypothetical protein
MTSDEDPGGPDDWFGEPEAGDAWSESADHPREPTYTAADDWLDDLPAREPAERSGRPLLGPAAIGVAALLVLLLIGVLAAAGVFSGSRKPASLPPVTTTPPTTSTPAAATTTQQQVASVPTAPLKPGDRGPAVARLQRALTRAGFSPGAADGVYGSATTQAVTRFQQAHSLTADGVAGPKTLAALAAVLQSG